MIGCLPTQALAFLAVFVYATHATQAIAFEWKPDVNPGHNVRGLRPPILNLAFRTPFPVTENDIVYIVF